MGEFDSIMVRVEIGGNRKFARFTPEERWCIVAGVWSLAAKSPVRGYLLIADSVPVEVDDVAAQAEVKAIIAKKTLEKMRRLGMLEMDEELGAEHVHDWHLHQKDPKPSETRESWRERQKRSRERKREDVTANVTRDSHAVTPPGESHPQTGGDVTPLKRREEKVREDTPQTPQGGDARATDRSMLVVELFAYWQERCKRETMTLTPQRRDKLLARLNEGRTVEEIRQAIDGAAASPHVRDDGKRFDDLELICRNATKFEDFKERSERAPRSLTGTDVMRSAREEEEAIERRVAAESEQAA